MNEIEVQSLKQPPLRKPPTGYLSTEEWFSGADFLRPRGSSYTEYHDDYHADYVDPKGLEDNIHWKFLIEKKRKPPPTFLAVIPGGRVLGNNGAVISPDSMLLADVSIYFDGTGGTKPGAHPIFKMTELPPVRKLEETVSALTFCASHYYYHWMFDVLPRLHLLHNQKMTKYRMIFNFNGLFPFQRETLARLKIPRARIIECHPHSHFKASRLVVPSPAGYTGHMPKWTCDFLRRCFIPKGNFEKIQGFERIYISRRNARSRKVLNEENVINVLSKYGFKVIILELMPFAEQVRLFLSADVIVSAHGGGFANLVFCNSGTKVLECFSPNYVHGFYWVLSNYVNLDYYYIIGEGERPDQYVDPFLQGDDIVINLEQLESMLKVMEI